MNSVNSGIRALKGICLVVMVLQHLTATLNALPYTLRTGFAVRVIHYLTLPFGTHLFLALAAFDLARRPPRDLRRTARFRVTAYLVVFLLAVFECALLPMKATHPFSIYPVQLWMLILAFLTVVYAYGGVRFVLGLFVFQAAFFWVLPFHRWNQALQDKIRTFPGWSTWTYHATFNDFLGSACVGLLLGYVFFRSKALNREKVLAGSVLGLLLYTVWLFWGGFTVSADQVFSTLMYSVQRLPGALAVWSVLAAMIGLGIHASGVRFKEGSPWRKWGSGAWKQLLWIGDNGLYLFLVHRIILTYILVPAGYEVGNALGHPLGNNLPDSLVLVAACILLCKWLKKWTGVLFFRVMIF